jgi:hypothetical protein
MVSKLLLAVEEIVMSVPAADADTDLQSRLSDIYYEIRDGIGVHKAPDHYGGFPTDPYSHTPASAGAQQPGLTGQVKEDILSRMGELGMVIENGCIRIRPILLKKSEFLQGGAEFGYYDVDSQPRTIALEQNTLAFTYCQVPFVYHLNDSFKHTITRVNGGIAEYEGIDIDKNNSSLIFFRTGEVSRVDVFLNL